MADETLTSWVASWDRDYEATLSPDAEPTARRPYGKVLDALNDVQHLRFQPYQNDALPSFVEKLMRWLRQFDTLDRQAAFLLANRVVFVTTHQFEHLQRRLFRACVRRHLLEQVIRSKSLAKFDYVTAADGLDAEMDATMFVGLTDSAQLNSFTHLNIEHFGNRDQRHLTGPDVRFWVYPSKMGTADHLKDAERALALKFETDVLAQDKRLRGKRRLVVIEDFSGTGSDFALRLRALAKTQLPFEEIIAAPVISTSRAVHLLLKLCRQLSTKGPRRYHVLSAMTLPHSLRCFDGPEASYLDGVPPWADLSTRVRSLSTKVYNSHLHSHLGQEHQHGFGKLALAFVMSMNCPDNSLPMLWKGVDSVWSPLFPRASRYI